MDLRFSAAPIIFLAAMLLFPSQSYALGQSACDPFSFIATAEGRIVSYHQLGRDGPGPGDIRPGVRVLTDADGTHIGQLRWYETLIGPEGEVGAERVSVVRYYVLLSEGTILGEYLNLSERDRPDVTRPPIGTDEVIILGGTGAYAGARGTMRQTVDTDGDPLRVAYDVNFVC